MRLQVYLSKNKRPMDSLHNYIFNDLTSKRRVATQEAREKIAGPSYGNLLKKK